MFRFLGQGVIDSGRSGTNKRMCAHEREIFFLVSSSETLSTAARELIKKKEKKKKLPESLSPPPIRYLLLR